MGSPADEKGRKDDETQHEVSIARPFWLGVFQLTQRQWKTVAKRKRNWHFSNSGSYAARVEGMDTSDFPVEGLRFREVQGFLKRLNAADAGWVKGYAYRLPTEAEWEYACRGAGLSARPFLFAAPSSVLHSSHVNYDGNYPYGSEEKGPYLRRTCPVGNYAPNPLGIHDVHGNVWEWCADHHVIRGGSWDSVAESCRAANRRRESATYRNAVLGFRVAYGPAIEADQ